MNISLKGKTALVCGASQGIGLAAARELALNGASCILLARNEGRLREAVESLSRQDGNSHEGKAVDFFDTDRLRLTVAEMANGRAVDILVNNSGGPKAGQVLDAVTEDFERAFRQHVVNNQLIVQALVPGMKKAGYGRIINIISTSVKTPLPNLGVSNTIRLAVAAWAKSLANEIAQYNITVNNVLPGLTETQRLSDLVAHIAGVSGKGEETVGKELKDSIPAKRFGRPEEIAALIAFLASPAAAYINGTSIPVDGGRTTAF